MATASKVLTAENDAIVFVTDMDVINSYSVQYGAGGAGTITFEGSNDNITWIAQALVPLGGGSAVTTLATSGIVSGNLVTRYLRVRKTVAGAGGVTVTVELHGGS